MEVQNFSGYCNNLQFIENGSSGNVKFSCLLNSYDSGNSLIGTNVTLGKDGTSRSYQPAQADTNYAMYVVISNNNNFTGSNVVYEQKQEYALKFKGADYTFSNFVCANAEVSTKANTVASVAQGTNTDYTKDYIVEDERDNKYYIVRKLYMRADDGTISTACWMTQNLDLDLVARYETSTTAAIYAYDRENNTINRLTVNNSDLTNNWTTASNVNSSMLYAHVGGGTGNFVARNWSTSYKFATLASGTSPVFPTTTSSDNRVSPSNENSENNPGMIDPGDIMYGPFNSTYSRALTPASNPSVQTYDCETNDTKCHQLVNSKYFTTEASGHIVSANAAGNYYNWYTVTAGSGNSSVTTVGTNVQGSICPKGWGIPTGYSSSSNNYNNNFGQLMGAYFPTAGVTKQDNSITYKIGDNYDGFTVVARTLKSNSGDIFTGTPLSFPRSDGTIYSSSSGAQGQRTFFWTATSSGSTNAYNQLSYSGTLFPGIDQSNRGYSVPVRCVQGI